MALGTGESLTKTAQDVRDGDGRQVIVQSVTVDQITRDATGRIVSWRENGLTTHTITRDGNGRVTAVS